MAEDEYKKLFLQAVDGFLNEEKNKRLANALFPGFKSLTELAKYVLAEKYHVQFGGKSSHQEIKLVKKLTHTTRQRRVACSLAIARSAGSLFFQISPSTTQRVVER